MSSLDQQFKDAVTWVRSSNTESIIDNQTKLLFYAYYKQATLGDVQGPQPGFLDVVGRAKYNARKEIKGLPKDQAKRIYINMINTLK